MTAIFLLHVLVYSAFPFFFAFQIKPLRQGAFYVYLGAVLLFGGFLGAVYALPITDDIRISGGNLAYGALIFTSIAFVAIERDAFILRNVIRLVVVVNVFKIVMFATILLSLGTDEVINPNGVSSDVFSVSLRIVLVGGALNIIELTMILFLFHRLARLGLGLRTTLGLYVAVFVAVLSLDGVLFPVLAFGFADGIGSVISAGVQAKLVLAAGFSVPLVAFFFVFRQRLADYVEESTFAWRLLLSPGRKLVAEQRERDERIRLASAVFDNASEGILVMSADSVIMSVNRAFVDMLGYSEADILGEDPSVFRSNRNPRGFYRSLYAELDSKGSWRGEIWNTKKDGEVVPDWLSVTSVHDETGALSHYVAVLSDLSTLKQSQDQLAHMEFHDPLTGLPNRLGVIDLLEEAMARADRTGSPLAVLMLDIDDFKLVNEGFGHSVGDELLKRIVERFVETLQDDAVSVSVTLSRTGGDEFAMLIEGCEDLDDVAVHAQRVLSSFESAYVISGTSVTVSTSIGICLYPDDERDASALLAYADAAMYRAKGDGKNSFQFYDQEMTVVAHERVALETQLRAAISNDELVLHYQPQWNLQSGDIIGMEALVRWQSPDRGLVPPGLFIPIAEESGLILPLGRWVLETACTQAQAWSEAGIFHGLMAVNISSVQFSRGTLFDEVQEVLDSTRLLPSRLELEITETSIMDRVSASMETLERLKGMGLTLSVDDFGTGYSSLNYLKQLPIQRLKVDQSFVRGLPDDAHDMAIVDAILALGGSLGLTVIAEGVETEAQADVLRAKGCSEAQGYLFGRPLPVDETTALLTQHHRAATNAVPAGSVD